MRKFLAVVSAVVLVAASFAGCAGSGSTSATSSSKSTVPSGLSGSINISGSSALQPFVQAAADSLKDSDPDLSITVNAGGSGKGLTDVSNKSVDIGDSDIDAASKLAADKASALQDHKICVIGVATVVNKSVTVKSLTQDQLIKIFTGKVKNWSEVGGENEPIVIVNRPSTSGTRSLYKKYALNNNEEATGTALSQDDSGLLEQTVATTKGSIGYLAMSYTKGKTDINILKFNGVEANYDNIYSGKYPIWGYEHMYTNGSSTGVVKKFLSYMVSKDFSAKAEDMGYGVSAKMKVTQ